MDLLYSSVMLVSLLLASSCVISHPAQSKAQEDNSVRNLSFGTPQTPNEPSPAKPRFLLPYTSDKRNPIYSFGLGKRYSFLMPYYDGQSLKRSPAAQPRFGFGLGKRSGSPVMDLGESSETEEYADYPETEADSEKRAYGVSENPEWLPDEDDDENMDAAKYIWKLVNTEEKRKFSPLRGYYMINDIPNYAQAQPRRNLEFKKRAKQLRVAQLGKRLPVYDFGLGKRSSVANSF